ncbi:hypothetical protein [Amycolatopsis nigrescens]|uniref:hypothetical protein n=1 Tax=Amycolatopsis nigrescens TaxID=381445 RepID=UPI00036D3006|nr:hypothetical protein [Amycolatopsis nigrescens]
MDLTNPVVQLCVEGMQAEQEGRADVAGALFLRAWQAAEDDYDACIAAHYLARQQSTPEDSLHWNQECLNRADLVGDERVRGFYASLHGNLARAYRELDRPEQAREHYLLAVRHLDDVPAGPYRDSITYALAEISED